MVDADSFSNLCGNIQCEHCVVKCAPDLNCHKTEANGKGTLWPSNKLKSVSFRHVSLEEYVTSNRSKFLSIGLLWVFMLPPTALTGTPNLLNTEILFTASGTWIAIYESKQLVTSTLQTLLRHLCFPVVLISCSQLCTNRLPSITEFVDVSIFSWNHYHWPCLF